MDGAASPAAPAAGGGRLLALVAGEQLDDLLADPVEVGAELDQHLGGDALALADQAEQDVLGADVVVAELQRLAQRQLQHLLGPRRERDVPARRLLALADDLLDLLADALQGDAEALQRLGGDALALVDQAEQDVLGADVVVVEHPGLFLGQDDHPPRSVGEPLEHALVLLTYASVPRELLPEIRGGEAVSLTLTPDPDHVGPPETLVRSPLGNHQVAYRRLESGGNRASSPETRRRGWHQSQPCLARGCSASRTATRTAKYRCPHPGRPPPQAAEHQKRCDTK